MSQIFAGVVDRMYTGVPSGGSLLSVLLSQLVAVALTSARIWYRPSLVPGVSVISSILFPIP